MIEDPMDKLRVIMDHVREIAEQHGLTLEGIAFIPSPEAGGPSFCQALFGVDPDVAFKSLEERETDKTFEMMMIQNKIDTDNQTVEDISKSGGMDLFKKIQGLGRGEGIGLDDPPEEEEPPEASAV